MQIQINQRDYLLIDHEDPIGQAYSWIDKYIDPSNKFDIVFGMGFGFHIEVLLTSFAKKKVLVVEPNIELFYQVFKVRNMETIAKSSMIFVDEEINVILSEIYTLFWDTDKGGIQVEPFEIYCELFEMQWNELRDKFIKQAQSFNVDMTTRKHLGGLWLQNYINNATKLGSASDISGLIGKFYKKPGIVVSAGPSLEKNIHLLKELKDKCVIMAAGTAVNILEKNGIIPHFMVGIDASEGEAEIHKSVKSKEIYFIYSNQVATGSLEYYNGPKFFMNFTIDTYTADLLKFSNIKSAMFSSGPSVSNTCFDILYKMGCDPIIFLGQDLAFTGGSNYAGETPGSVLKENINHQENGYILAKDIYGQDTYTNLMYISIKNFFEGYFERVKDKVEIINATEGGLNIEYANNSTLENVINNKNFEAFDVMGIINKAYEENIFHNNIEDKLKDYNASIISEIERLEAYSRKQLKLVDLIERDIYHPNKNKNAFDKMAKSVADLTNAITESSIFNSTLKNLIQIDFFLLKVEVDRETKNLQNYNDVKKIYNNAIIKQNEILNKKLQEVRNYILNSQ